MSAQSLDLISAVRNERSLPLGITRSRELAGENPSEQMEFTFTHQGFLFAVRARSHEQATEMQFRAHLGNLPYTFENPHARINAFSVVEAAGLALGGRITLTKQQRIMLSELIVINEPFTPTLLVTKAASLILRVEPYLDLLSMIITPPIISQPH